MPPLRLTSIPVALALVLLGTGALALPSTGAAQPATFASEAIPRREYGERRRAVTQALDSGVVLVAGARDPVVHWPPFYQLPAFRYLTGYLLPDATLVLVKQRAQTRGVLFVPATNLRTALYDGRVTDPVALSAQTGLDVRYTTQLPRLLDSLATSGLPWYPVTDAQANEFTARDSLTFLRALVRRYAAAHPALTVRDGTPLVDYLRAKKSAAEEQVLRRAVAISDSGHVAAMRAIRPGLTEYQVQAEMEYAFRRLGGDRPGYASIVGTGSNSTLLHYDAGDRVLKAGEVILMDVAVQYDGYSADVTRTVPVTGRYTAEQRAVYEIVLAAQKAFERQIRPGTPSALPNDSSRRVLIAGMERLGLIESATATFDAPDGLCPARAWIRKDGEPCPQWYLYSYHGYSHGIGLDVHDPAQFADHPSRTYELGDVFTIEPGLYVRRDALKGLPDTPRNRQFIAAVQRAVAKYADTGVRIEDDYRVTPSGIERLSQAPREIPEIEALMRRVQP
ncbi:MAG: aminopeptidase P N-terminal domain-containing protein [Gemmatimonadaceae bacterium]|nr:aminopeptidase P N-terminal domain-containing protein [Gemmatimonadaceae bacterium]